MPNLAMGSCTSSKHTCDTRNSFLAGQIRDVDECIIEAGEDMCNAEDEFAICDLGSERNGVFFLGCLDFLGCLKSTSSSV